MFSFVNDVVLDPFLGSGTTLKVALELKRSGVGYEINKNFLEIIKKKVNNSDILEIKERESDISLPEIDYIPKIQNAQPKIDPKKFKFRGERLYKVVAIPSEDTLELDTGLRVKSWGLKIRKREEVLDYLKKYILGKEVFLKSERSTPPGENTIAANVYLKNKIFINKYLIKSGRAVPWLKNGF